MPVLTFGGVTGLGSGAAWVGDVSVGTWGVPGPVTGAAWLGDTFGDSGPGAGTRGSGVEGFGDGAEGDDTEGVPDGDDPEGDDPDGDDGLVLDEPPTWARAESGNNTRLAMIIPRTHTS